MRLTLLLRRLRTAGPRALLRALVPRRVDELLYVADASMQLPASPCAVPVEMQRFDQDAAAGNPDIDRRLDGHRACYVARVHGRIAHRSWLHYDTALPSLFGHASAPVIGDCMTDAEFRGLHLYPHMLAHIVADVRARAAADTVHVLVSPDNAASIRGIERAGFRLAARLRGVRIGPVVLRRRLAAGAAEPVRAGTTRARSA
jgi:RimJ/RimL family protein N-acetyltransferase